MTNAFSISASVAARNPDVLTCLANLSNDEVFTPPNVVDRLLDLLPSELFRNPETTFLDPACKSGVFLREIAKRLVVGLEDAIPDFDERVEHVFKRQIFGIATSAKSAALTRRTLYCAKEANGERSVVRFDDAEGNVRFAPTLHRWDAKGKCVACGASRKKDADKPAYGFLHVEAVKEIFNMDFDVIIGNPPYQLGTNGAGKQAKPIYNLFIERAKKLNPRHLCMIIPSRWFTGGMGLASFRDEMMNDSCIVKLVDYSNAKECFPQNSIGGGVCYFLRSTDKPQGKCEVTNIYNGEQNTTLRKLNEFPVVVRYNRAVAIVHKILNFNEPLLQSAISPLMPFGLSTNVRGSHDKESSDDLVLHASNNSITYIKRNAITKGHSLIDKYKILISKTGAEHAGEPSQDGKFRVMTSSMKVIGPGEVCTHSYFIIGCYNERLEAENTLSYLRTRFVRFLVLLAMSSINLSKLVFPFVPTQDFSKPWTDEELYAKYQLTDEEIAFIESMIRPMSFEDDAPDSAKKAKRKKSPKKS